MNAENFIEIMNRMHRNLRNLHKEYDRLSNLEDCGQNDQAYYIGLKKGLQSGMTQIEFELDGILEDV